jgi:hypothetical protein
MLNKKTSASYGLCVKLNENYTTVVLSLVEVCQDQRKCFRIPYIQVSNVHHPPIWRPCSKRSRKYIFCNTGPCV